MQPSPQDSGIFLGICAVINTDVPQKSNGNSFEDSTLSSLGLVVQLLHSVVDTCPTNNRMLCVLVSGSMPSDVVRSTFQINYTGGVSAPSAI